MDFYWVYDLPNWLFFLITVLFFIGFSLLSAVVFNTWLEKKLDINEQHNSIVEPHLTLSSVFYGITLGLIAVSAHENFNTTEEIVNNESSELNALYRDVSILVKPEKINLQNTLKEYTEYVVKVAWPLQQQGIIPTGTTDILNTFQNQLSQYVPDTEQDKIFYTEVIKKYNELNHARRLRINAVNNSLPSNIYLILILGAFINIIFTSSVAIKNKKLNILLSVLSGLLIGSLVFLIASMDNPFRGDYSVKSDSFQFLLDGLMK